ncbi:MAG: aminotransferase class V-fold PLP-dependent enzyme [Candidatus Bathyarchaeia archaeon]
MNIQRVREEFPITRNKVFLNHAGQSPPPKPVVDAMGGVMEEFSEGGTVSADLGEARRLFARLIDAEAGEIALVPNTSTGINIIANMLDYPRGSNVVVTDLEFPSVVYPWLRAGLGVEVRYLKNVGGKILLGDVERAVDDRTAVVAISHVEYPNGFRHDLGSLAGIAHEHGAYLLVDAVQSAGAMQIDVRRDGVDFLAASCYKWMLGPSGAGFLYVRRELVEGFEPPFVGWASVRPEVFETVDFWDIWDLKLSETASRFEVGSPSLVSFVGAAAALRLILDVGIEKIEGRILGLTSHLIEGVKGLGFKLQTPEEEECRSGIVNFLIDDPQGWVERLGERGIIVSARAKGLRASPHFYNTIKEIDCLLDELTLNR